MNVIKYKNFWVILAADFMLLGLAYFMAYWLRFDGQASAEFMHLFYLTLVPCLVIKVCVFSFFDLYRGMWRYAGIKDLTNVIKASIMGSIALVVYLAMLHHFNGIPRSVLVIDCVLTLILIGGLRMGVRLYFQRDQGFFDEIHLRNRSAVESKRVLIMEPEPWLSASFVKSTLPALAA